MFGLLKKDKEENKSENLSNNKKQTDYNDSSLVAEFFKNETGVTFDQQESILTSKLKSFCHIRDILSFSQLLNTVKIDAYIKQELIDYLTTNESFFYREFSQIETLVKKVKNHFGKIDILCAPSATGEEAYSIAIALLEASVDPHSFSITGIDINSQAIEKAHRASYKERNIRNLSPEIVSKYFTFTDNEYKLHEKIKSLVTFKQINIFDSAFASLGKFDFILSRNMLIYFDKETKLRAINILENRLKDPQKKIYFGHADLF